LKEGVPLLKFGIKNCVRNFFFGQLNEILGHLEDKGVWGREVG
jgi:hypothetical protein